MCLYPALARALQGLADDLAAGRRRCCRVGRPAAVVHAFDSSLIPAVVYQDGGTLKAVPATSPRIQVTVDPELDAALSEFAGSSRSRAVRDLALRGAEALREEKRSRHDATGLLQRIADGDDDRFDFSVSAELHANRR